MSGTFEHIGSLTHIINQARLKQHSIFITLLDLRNAFGEVNHNLIGTVLAYHHIPAEVSSLIANLYSDFFTAIRTGSFTTEFILVERGVLQGYPLSPLIFNILIRTFVQYIKFLQFGYQLFKHLPPTTSLVSVRR